MSGPPPPPPPPPPASLTTLNLAPLTYEMMEGGTETYAIRARIGVRPEPGEEIAYVTLYRQAVDAGGGAQGPEEYVADMSWYASSPLPLDDMEYYEGYDYGYYVPSPPAAKWDYHVKIFVMKYITQKSGNVSYP
ncbi:MAG TPA: hypothetical protein VMM56_04430 [Planctomycetaceae bacterium]|nr:hypothetical protein [Planctomycetaceae bacterium]